MTFSTPSLAFQIVLNGKPVKTISAKSMNSIYSQYNGWAKAKGSLQVDKAEAVGMMVWQTPKGIAELVAL